MVTILPVPLESNKKFSLLANNSNNFVLATGVKLFVGLGLLITITLAICFFPLYAMTRAFSGSLTLIKYETHPMNFEEPKLQNEPIVGKEETKDSKVKK